MSRQDVNIELASTKKQQEAENLAFVSDDLRPGIRQNRQILEIKYENFSNKNNPFFEDEDETVGEPSQNFQYIDLNADTRHRNNNTDPIYRVTIHTNTKCPDDLFSRIYVEYMLDNKFPSKLVVGSIAFGGLVNSTMIILQIAGILVHSPFYFLGSGIWSGIFMLFIQATITSLIYDQHLEVVKGINELYTQAIFINIAFITINLYAMSESCVGLGLLYNLQCTEGDYAGYNAAIIVLNIANLVLCAVFKIGLKKNLSKVKKLVEQNQTMSQAMQAFDNSLIDSNDPDE